MVIGGRAKRVCIVGGGPAGLMAAEALASAAEPGEIAVRVHDRMPTLARKLLIAGRGGLNLTHSEPLDRFLARYGAARDVLAAAIEAFPPDALRDWAHRLGQDTFVGSSGRVFPRAFKASPLLRAWLARLASLGVAVVPRSRWEGFDAAGRPLFSPAAGGPAVPEEADAVILALGGGSWPRLGADAGWVPVLRAMGVPISPIAPSNCGFTVPWRTDFSQRWAGSPLKGVSFSFRDRNARGECILTASGLEGGAIYALSAALRDAIAADGYAVLVADLRPDVPLDVLAARLARSRPGESLANRLRKAGGLAPASAALLRECFFPLPRDPQGLAEAIKGVPVRLTATAGLDRAISSAGGVALEAIDDRFMLKDLPGVFVAGEMLDWEAPTGGYLLQGCFATGRAAGLGALSWLRERGDTA